MGFFRWLLFLTLAGLAGGMAERSVPASENPAAFQPTFQSILEAEATAHLLAILLDSGRNVIDENQALFDDVEQGPKGFTPDVFEARLREVFRLRSGVDLEELESSRLPDATIDLLRKLVRVSTQVVQEAQPEINQPGIGFKGFIPAVFGTRVASRYANLTGVRLGQRALAPRNPANRPDSFERAALLEFADPSYPRERIITEVKADTHRLRLMFPLYATRGCLACHGEPKGAIDKTGYPREGLQLGQNAGGISVVIPLRKE